MASGVVDGAVIVDTSIKNDKSKIGAREFVSMVQNMNKAANQAGQRMSSSVGGYVQAMNRARGAAKAMTGDQAALAKEILRTSDAIRKMEERQEKAREKFEAAREDAVGQAMEKFKQNNAGAEAMPWENEEQAMEQLAEDMNRVAQEAADAFGVFEDTAAFRNSSVEIDYMKERLAALQAQLTGTAQAGGEAAQGVEEVAAAGAAGGGWAALGAVVGKAAGGFLKLAGHAARAGASVAKIAGSAALSYLRKLAASAKNAAIQLAKLAANAMKSGIKKLGGMIGSGVKSLLGFNRESQRGSNGLKQGLMMLLRYGLGIRGLFALFRRLRSAVAEGLGEIEKRNPKVKSAMDSLRGALTALRGSLGSAFAPIVTAVAPALTKLINMLVSAINTVGALIAALTGQKSYQKAVSGLNATGSAASGAASEVKELNRQLAGFDQLEILSAKDNGSGGGGGGGGAGGGVSYETEEIPGGIADFVGKLKEMWANADYEGIGREIAGCINKGFEVAKNAISWDSLGAKITEVVTGITGIINGLVDGVNWTLIGETFGEGINTLIKTLNLLLTGIDWESIGTGFANGLNGLVKTVPWDELGQLFANRINALIGVIKGAVSKFNWGAAGTAFATMVNNLISTVNWEDMATAATTGINGVISALRVAVNAFNWSYAATAFTNTVNGLLTGVDWDALAETASTSVNKVVGALRIAVNNFKWDYAATAFTNFANSLITDFDWAGLADLATTSVNKIIGALRIAVNTFDWDYAATAFTNFVNSLVKDFDWVGLADLATTSINKIVSALRVAVNTFDWSYAATSFSNFVNSLVKDTDWDGIAGTATTGANKILSSLRTTINGFDWSYAGTKFGQTLNNLISGFDWENLGHLAQDALAKPLGAIRLAVSEFDFSYAASSFAKTVNAFFDNPQMWADAGTIVSDGIKGLFTWGADFLNNLDVKKISNDIKVAISKIDWHGIAEAMWEFLKAAVKALGKSVTELFSPTEESDSGDYEVVVDAVGNVYFVPKPGEGMHIEGDHWELDETVVGDALIGLVKDGWTSITNWLGLAQQVLAKIGLTKDGWTSISNFVGTAVKVLTTLGKDNWTTIGKYVGTAVTVLASLAKKDDKQSPGVLFNVSSVLGFVSTLARKDGAKSPAEVWNAGGSLGAYVSTLARKDGAKKPSEVWSAGESIGEYFSTLARDKKAKKPKEVWNAGSNFGYTGTLAQKNKNQKPSKVFSAGSTFSYTGTLVKGWGNKSPQKALGLTGLTTTITANFAKGKNDTVSVSGSGGTWRLAVKELGGVFQNGIWRSIPQYARGTLRAGSIFAAGEAGPELVGHIGGRTEVLNKSQLAATMHAAVYSGMLAALSRLSFRMPAMATGTVMPYEVAAQAVKTGEDIQNTLNANNEDLIQTIISVAAQLVAAVQASGRSQQPADPTGGLTARQIIDDINRRTQMFGASPLTGI